VFTAAAQRAAVGEDGERVTAPAQPLRHIAAAQTKTAAVVRGVKSGDEQDVQVLYILRTKL